MLKQMTIPKPFFLLIIIIASCSGSTNDQSYSQADITKINLKELNDQPIDLTQYQGKTVFVNFWATWCKPCIQEMPTIENAQNNLKNENVIFLFASNEDTDQIETFKKRHAYNFHYVILENMEELRIQSLPTTFIFNSEGKLKFSETGYRKWDDPDNIELITRIINDHEK
jgi:thiol-disulfide isomerase/thioredoxin